MRIARGCEAFAPNAFLPTWNADRWKLSPRRRRQEFDEATYECSLSNGALAREPVS